MSGETRNAPGVVAAATAILLPVAFSPATTAPSWTARAALLLLLLGAGLPLVWAALREPTQRATTMAGLALAGVAFASAALSPRPALAVFGAYGTGTGALFVTSFVAAWALGSASTERSRRDIRTGLLIGGVVNSVVAAAQTLLDLSPFGLALYDLRAAGLFGNPVHLGGFLAGCVLLALHHAGTSRTWWPTLLVPVFGVAIQLSGSRITIAVVLAAGVAWAGARRDRRAVVAVAGLVAGLLAGVVVAGAGSAMSATARVEQGVVSDESSRARFLTWADATDAIAERPVIGHGPGRYLTATTPHRDLDLARIGGGDSYFRDAHNIVVEYATTTGVAGVVALLVFVGLALFHARGGLRLFAVGVLLVALLQPQFVGTTPLAFLALGAASTSAVGRRSRVRGPATIVGAALALPLAALLLVRDVRIEDARLDGSPEALLSAARLLPPWPEPRNIAGKLYVVEARFHPPDAGARDAVRWHRAAVDADPEDPRWWNDLGAIELAAGDHDAARRSFLAGLRRSPHSPGALIGLARVERDLGDQVTADRWLDRAEVVVGVTDQIADLRRPPER